ncbi:MAG: aminotransferase class V-fold PLP-dependent enzyme, partial [Oscillospiraceae bacterium]|nr:aminotransferase class V-fold PLP-dependent enzyme [Oscillospiraceae bacterium]
RGPKGVGVLYARRGVRLSTLIEGGAQERGKRAGTENVPGIAAMAAALDEANEKMAENAAHLTAMRDRLIAGLREIPHAALNGDAVQRLPGNVNFCFEGIEGESLLLLLDDKGICASSGSACTSGSLDPSHVLLAIGRVHDVAHGSLRLSLGEDVTDEQVDYLIRSVREVVEYLRGFSPIWRDLMAGKKEFIL